MIHYLKTYPLSIILIMTIGYLSFFTPPETSISEIPNIDKLIHICMYGGFTIVLWLEYLLKHHTISRLRLIAGGIIAPIIMSGIFEILQETCTDDRGGDWFDLLANITGIFLGSFLSYYILNPLLNKKKKA